MSTIFVANRGEIAARIIGTAQALGHRCAVARPSVDADLPYVMAADVVVDLVSPRDFADVEAMTAAAVQVGADLVHPGYGFLSENADFARAVRDVGMTFIGPSAEVIETMGDKANARQVAALAGVAGPAGSDGPVADRAAALAVADAIGYPLMVKAVAGGGGIGMAVARDETQLVAALDQVTGRAQTVFGDGRLIIERYVERARHVEVQVMGLPDGQVVALGERDCSVQRRHQKVVEESPSPVLDVAARAQLRAQASSLAKSVGYLNAGTVEFLYDLDSGEIAFLEMNTRLQVEHPVTEVVHGVDLVAWQIAIAQGSSEIPAGLELEPRGHAIELRVYAEDSVRFLPRPGTITTWNMPQGKDIRVDAGYRLGNSVTPYFDPLLAKIIASGSTRPEALAVARAAIGELRVDGPGVNVDFLSRVLASAAFESGQYPTGLVG